MSSCATDLDLPLDEVQSGHHFRHRVLDLQARVHLHEEELVRRLRGHDEFDGTGADIAARPCGLDGRSAHPFAGRLVQQHRRRLLDDLLVTTLKAALALTEVDHVAVRVRQHLNLDMPRRGDEPFHEQRVVAERTLRLAARRLDRVGQLCRVGDQPHPLTTATGGRLEQQRIADLFCRGAESIGRNVHIGFTRHNRHTSVRNHCLRADLVAHRLDRAHRRTDEYQTCCFTGPRELGILS
jgi:hypothetical protein